VIIVKLIHCFIVEWLHCYIATNARIEAEAKAKATLNVEGNFGILPSFFYQEKKES